MPSINSRVRRIEERIEFLMDFFECTKEYQEIRAEREAADRKLSKQQLLNRYAELSVEMQLAKIESMLDVLLRWEGCFNDWAEHEKKVQYKKTVERRQLAMINENNEALKQKARLQYANQKRTIGEPVWVEGKFVYIDPPEQRRTK